MPAHWWVELSLGPLVGRAIEVACLEVAVGSGNLLANCMLMGGAVFPTLLVVWPEASENWSLQAVGQGQVFLQKWQPP